MSDSFIALVNIDIAAADAPAAAERLVQFLVDRQIVLPRRDAGDSAVLLPGPGAGKACENVQQVYRTAMNGVEPVVGRQVHDTGGNGVELECAGCSAHFEPEHCYFNACTLWAEGNDRVEFTCPACGERFPLVDWDGPFSFAFGSMALRFWNWPPLRPEFVRLLASAVAGRWRTVRAHL